MDIRQLVGVVRRRWGWLVLLLPATFVVTAQVADRVPTRYSAEARVLFEPPAPSGLGAGPGNPLTGLSSSLAVVADLVALVVNDGTTRDVVAARGALDYDVSVATVETVSENWVAVAGSASVPLLVVHGRGADAAEALRTVEVVSDRVHLELAHQQQLSGADEAAFMTSRTLLAPTGARKETDARTRAAFGLFGVGVLLSTVVVVLIDGVRSRPTRTPGGDLQAPVGHELVPHSAGRAELPRRAMRTAGPHEDRPDPPGSPSSVTALVERG